MRYLRRVDVATTVRPLARLERLCREARSSDELAERGGSWLAELCEADAHCFLRIDPLSALWLGAADRGYEVGACDAYREAFLRSPHADFGRSALEAERVVTLTRGETPEDAYTRIYLDGYGFEQEVHVSFAQGGQAFGYLILSRRRGVFPETARRTLDAAVGPVTQSLRRLLAKEMLESVPGEHVGLMFVEPSGRLVAANQAGESILRHFFELGPMQATSPLALLAELARRELSGHADARPIPRVMYVDPKTRRRYRLMAERMLSDGTGSRALVMAEPIRALDSVELLRTAGLTEREAEVALVLLRGFKSSEGAEALGVSEHTFLSHLKAVYKKLGVASRGELAALVLGAP